MAGFLTHQVLTTDTLRGLAVRYFGDHTRWVDIAKANGIQVEYQDLSAYRELVIPLAIGPDTELADDPFLVDLAVEGGGLALDDRGNLRTVKGATNLLTSLLRALTTPLGSLVAHPGYGIDLDRYVGFAGTPLYHRFLALEVKRVILRDPRVASVANVRTRQLAGRRQIEIAAEIQPIGSPDVLRLVFEREAA